MQVCPRLMVTCSLAHCADIAMVTFTPILALNMHYFWSYTFNEHFILSSVRPACGLRMLKLDGQKHEPLYGYFFVNLPFVTSRFLPACVALALAIIWFLRRIKRRHPSLESLDTVNVNRLRRFLLNDLGALDLRDRTTPFLMVCYLCCAFFYSTTYVLSKALTLAATVSQCTHAVVKLLLVIGRLTDVLFLCCVYVALLVTNSQFRRFSDVRRWLCPVTSRQTSP